MAPNERKNVKSVGQYSIVKMEENWFGLKKGQHDGHAMTSIATKLNSTSQKFLACKILRIFVHWGPFYGTFWWRLLTLLSPFIRIVVNNEFKCSTYKIKVRGLKVALFEELRGKNWF